MYAFEHRCADPDTRLLALVATAPRIGRRSWHRACDAAPRAIFPGRRIGRLAGGFEASFLVLSGDPLTDFAHTGHISMRVKQGHPITPSDTALPPPG